MEQFIYLFRNLPPHTVDLLLVALTFLAGRLSGGIGVFLWMTIFAARVLAAWFTLHPVGQKIASISQLDEHLKSFCKIRLNSVEVAACGGKGEEV